MIPDEVKEIVVNLVSKSKNGKVNWYFSGDAGFNPAEGGNDYIINFPDYSINIWKSAGKHRIFLAFYDSEGRTIYDLNVTPGDDEDFTLLTELFELARRSVLQVDKALDSLLKITRRPGVIGELWKDKPPS